MIKDIKQIIIAVVFLVASVTGLMFLGLWLQKNDEDVKDIDFSKYSVEDITDSKTIGASGVYRFSSDYQGTITVNASKSKIKLILDGVSLDTKGPAINIVEADTVYIELVNDNTIKSVPTEDLNGAIYSKADLLLTGKGTLTIESTLDGIVGRDDVKISSGTYNITASDDGIVGKDALIIEDGIFDIKSNGDGLKTSNEKEQGNMTLVKGTYNINSKGDGITSIAGLKIEGGTFNITSGEGQTLRNNSSSMKGIKSNGDLEIIDGKINITSTDDSLHTNGNITITNGTITVSSSDDGIHADKNLTIKDGSIEIKKSYEGLEGENITIDGGNIKVVASDDGMNAAGGDGSSYGRPGSPAKYNTNASNIKINGGTIYVNASGDGIDSNGNIYITGGTTYVDGPTNNGNGPMDYGDGGSYKFEVTGGELIAVGAKGMAVSPTSASVQTVFVNLDNAYDDEITIGDISYKPAKAYNSILICSNKLKQNESYTLKINKVDILNISLNNIITTYGNTGGMGGGPRRGW